MSEGKVDVLQHGQRVIAAAVSPGQALHVQIRARIHLHLIPSLWHAVNQMARSAARDRDVAVRQRRGTRRGGDTAPHHPDLGRQPRGWIWGRSR